jgi:hypothetical protein
MRRAPAPLLIALTIALALAGCGSETAAVDAGSGADAATGDSGSCPRVTCADLDLSGGASATRYDAATHVLTLVLGVGAPQVVTGSVSFMSAPAATAPSTHSAPLVVSGTSASADLSAWLSAGTVYFGALSLTFVGSCGSTSVIGNLDVTTAQGASGLEVSSFVCR